MPLHADEERAGGRARSGALPGAALPRARRTFRIASLAMIAVGTLFIAVVQAGRSAGRTIPHPAADVAILAESRLCPDVAAIVGSWTPQQRIAQQVIAYLPPDAGTGAEGAEGAEDAPALGGILLNRDHGPRIGELRSYTDRLPRVRDSAALAQGAAPPPLLAIDQEGGWVTRIIDPQLEIFPSNEEVGAFPQGEALASVRRQGEDYAAALLASGIQVNFAPVVDIATADSDIISRYERAYSDDPAVVAELSRTFVQALQGGGVAATLKHFPGHGMVIEDSHTTLPRTDIDPATLEAVHLRPYRDLLTDPATDADRLLIMTAHVLFESLDPTAPASLSRIVTTELLRRDLGYDGVVITDALGMGALDGTLPERAVRALAAGADMILLGPQLQMGIPAVLDAAARAYDSGALAWDANAASLERILRLKRALGLVTEPTGCIGVW